MKNKIIERTCAGSLSDGKKDEVKYVHEWKCLSKCRRGPDGDGVLTAPDVCQNVIRNEAPVAEWARGESCKRSAAAAAAPTADSASSGNEGVADYVLTPVSSSLQN